MKLSALHVTNELKKRHQSCLEQKYPVALHKMTVCDCMATLTCPPWSALDPCGILSRAHVIVPYKKEEKVSLARLPFWCLRGFSDKDVIGLERRWCFSPDLSQSETTVPLKRVVLVFVKQHYEFLASPLGWKGRLRWTPVVGRWDTPSQRFCLSWDHLFGDLFHSFHWDLNWILSDADLQVTKVVLWKQEQRPDRKGSKSECSCPSFLH